MNHFCVCFLVCLSHHAIRQWSGHKQLYVIGIDYSKDYVFVKSKRSYPIIILSSYSSDRSDIFDCICINFEH